MGAIIGILSRLFSGAGLIVLVLLGLVIGALGDVLLAMLYIYAAIVWVVIILALLPGVIIFIATLFEYLIYPFRWLNNILLGAEKPEFDFLNLKSQIDFSYKKFFKRIIKSKKVPIETISNDVDTPNAESNLNLESAESVSEKSLIDDNDYGYEYDFETESYERRKICEHLDYYDSCDDGLIDDLEEDLYYEDYDDWDDSDWEEYVENKRRCRSAYY